MEGFVLVGRIWFGAAGDSVDPTLIYLVVIVKHMLMHSIELFENSLPSLDFFYNGS